MAGNVVLEEGSANTTWDIIGQLDLNVTSVSPGSSPGVSDGHIFISVLSTETNSLHGVVNGV